MSASISSLIAPVAKILLGAPNDNLSSKDELRYGSRGSTSVDLTKGTWFDHERGAGGGVLDLIRDHTGLADQGAYQWIEEHGLKTEPVKATPRPNGKSRTPPIGRIVARYGYQDEYGKLVFEVVRYDPKDFRQRRPDPENSSGWTWSIKGTKRIPYRLAELVEQIALGRTVLIVEGEKDVDNLRTIGVPATCNAGGAGKWSADLNEYFRNADIVIIPDNDPQARDSKTGEPRFHGDGRPIFPGQDHADDVARHLYGVAARIRIVDLAKHWSDAPPKADISDWLALGHSRDDLDALIDLAEDCRPRQQVEGSDPAIKVEGKSLQLILSSAEFVDGFVPPDCVLQGVLQRRFLYSFTGKTGSGKTAILLLLAAYVGLGKPIGDRSVETGRVLYFAGENPDDVRMRWIAMAQQLGFELDEIPVHFIPGVFKISQLTGRIRAEVERIGPVSLVIVDTSAAYFEGDEENSNVQLGNHARRLRGLINLPGEPCVIAACHPVKNALDDNLIPRGGGSFLAEVDGNLIAKPGAGGVEVHWQGKIRGPDFPPMHFHLRSVTHERLKDSKGRLIPTVVASPISEQAREDIANVTRSREDEMLAALLDPVNCKIPKSQLARRLNWLVRTTGEPNHVQVARVLKSLETNKLIRVRRNVIKLTPEGKNQAEQVCSVRTDKDQCSGQPNKVEHMDE